MKKTKLLAPILTIAGLGAMVAPLVSLTSCGDKESLKITESLDEHINRLEYEGDKKINKTLLVNVIYKEDAISTGWGAIDKTNTVIKNGSRTLTIDQDYEISNAYQIIIKGEALKEQNLSIDVKIAPTTYDFEYEWKNVVAIGENSTFLGIPGQKITAANLNVNAINGKGEKIKAEPGEGLNQYQIYYNYQDVTSQFTGSGFEFTESMMEEEVEGKTIKKVKQVNLTISIKLDSGDTSLSLLAFCGHKPTKEKLRLNQTELHDPEGSYINAITDDDMYPDSKFEIDEDGTTAEGAKVEQQEETGDWYVYWNKGQVDKVIKIKIISLLDSSIVSETVLDVEKTQPQK